MKRKEAATEETTRQQTKHVLSSISMEGRKEAYSAFTIINRIGMDDGVQKGSLKIVTHMRCSGRECVNSPQHGDLGGQQKSWFSRPGAEKMIEMKISV